jgi:hypothetical protein
LAAHKSWWDAKTGYAYLSGVWPGWRGQHLIIYDLRDPANPKFLTNWGLPGQHPGDSSKETLHLHHPVISGNRAYLSYLVGGDMGILDIADKSNPKMIARLDFSPPFSGIHTTFHSLVGRFPISPKASGTYGIFWLLWKRLWMPNINARKSGNSYISWMQPMRQTPFR